jgi:hypothetical protein
VGPVNQEIAQRIGAGEECAKHDRDCSRARADERCARKELVLLLTDFEVFLDLGLRLGTVINCRRRPTRTRFAIHSLFASTNQFSEQKPETLLAGALVVELRVAETDESN